MDFNRMEKSVKYQKPQYCQKYKVLTGPEGFLSSKTMISNKQQS